MKAEEIALVRDTIQRTIREIEDNEAELAENMTNMSLRTLLNLAWFALFNFRRFCLLQGVAAHRVLAERIIKNVSASTEEIITSCRINNPQIRIGR